MEMSGSLGRPRGYQLQEENALSTSAQVSHAQHPTHWMPLEDMQIWGMARR